MYIDPFLFKMLCAFGVGLIVGMLFLSALKLD